MHTLYFSQKNYRDSAKITGEKMPSFQALLLRMFCATLNRFKYKILLQHIEKKTIKKKYKQ